MTRPQPVRVMRTTCPGGQMEAATGAHGGVLADQPYALLFCRSAVTLTQVQPVLAATARTNRLHGAAYMPVAIPCLDMNEPIGALGRQEHRRLPAAALPAHLGSAIHTTGVYPGCEAAHDQVPPRS